MIKFFNKKNLAWMATAVLFVAVFVGLFIAMPYASGYGRARRSMVYWLWYFWRSPEWQHGALVIPIVAFIFWKLTARRKTFTTKSSDFIGFGSIVFSLLLYFAGHRSNIYYFGYASCHLMVVGIVIWFAGWPTFRRMLFPLFFLGFAWPLYFLESQLGFPLRMIMTELSSGILNGVGVEHLKLGTAIVSVPEGRFALEVANPCSGIRSLFALMMIGALYGFFVVGRSWQWFAMCILAVPLAIAGNVVRILLLTGGSIWFGSDFAIGSERTGTSTFHFVAGIAVFIVAVGGMVLLGKVMRLRFRDRKADAEITLKTQHVGSA